ncbi:hypothetical protein WUBG_16923 [Wuchereria bancrofti]|uniref:Uncharacterized protein n=1 Tax=Wuchereria bancrofti TaxID=6293 RepID=J9ADU5_WUCBA|nr:hypothetical protein WUBG_16923 [Wuchereria bancrofti]
MNDIYIFVRVIDSISVLNFCGLVTITRLKPFTISLDDKIDNFKALNGGIGIAMLLVAICKSLILSYSVIGIFHTLKSITTAFISLSQTTWLECVYESHC